MPIICHLFSTCLHRNLIGTSSEHLRSSTEISPSSSPHHLITSSPHHLITSSPHHLIASSPHRLITSSPHHLITSSPHHLISLQSQPTKTHHCHSCAPYRSSVFPWLPRCSCRSTACESPTYGSVHRLAIAGRLFE